MSDVSQAKHQSATLAELQCFRDVAAIIEEGNCDTAHQVWTKTRYVPSYCKTIMERLRGADRWNRTLMSGKPLKLTDDGRRAYEYACRILDEHTAGPFAARREILRVGTTNRVMTAFLGPKVREFLWQHRLQQENAAKQKEKAIDVDLELRESSLDEILSELRREEIDIAIGGVSTEGAPPHLNQISIDGRLATVLIAGRNGCGDFGPNRLQEGRPVKWNELAHADICVIRSDLRGVLGHLPTPVAGYSRIVVENYASVVSVVKSGAAVGLVLDMGLPDDVLKFELDAAERPDDRELAIWTRRGETPTAIATAFIKVVTAMESNK